MIEYSNSLELRTYTTSTISNRITKSEATLQNGSHELISYVTADTDVYVHQIMHSCKSGSKIQ
jgi:hypothetical protein